MRRVIGVVGFAIIQRIVARIKCHCGNLIVGSIVSPLTEVFTELPLEFASEADRLLSLKLEGSVG